MMPRIQAPLSHKLLILLQLVSFCPEALSFIIRTNCPRMLGKKGVEPAHAGLVGFSTQYNAGCLDSKFKNRDRGTQYEQGLLLKLRTAGIEQMSAAQRNASLDAYGRFLGPILPHRS